MDDNERLIRVETKLDGIQTTLDVRLSHLEGALTHERANRAQADEALKVEIEKRATKDEVAIVSEIAREAKGTIARLGWTVILTVVGAVLALVVGDRVV